MLDIKRIRHNPQELLDAASARGICIHIDELLKQDEERRCLLAKSEEKKFIRNDVAKKLGIAKKQRTSETEVNRLLEEMRMISCEIDMLDKKSADIADSLGNLMSALPNYLNPEVPCQDTEIRHWGTPRAFPWQPKTSAEIAKDLALLNKVSENVVISRGMGAKLERALTNFFLDHFTANGYEETAGIALCDTGNCLLKDQILEGAKLPLRVCAAASLSQQPTIAQGNALPHRFHQVDLLAATEPNKSNEELDAMLLCAEKAFQELNLPYRVLLLSAKQTAVYAAKSYRLEVWMPSTRHYAEIAVFSDCSDFLARRNAIRFRKGSGEKPQYVHTITGVGIQIARTVSSILENYQNEDGSVTIPEALCSFVGNDVIK